MEFTASEIDFAIEDLVAQLYLAEDDSEGHTIDIQTNLDEPDESDVRLGMDTYYISIDEDQAVYGGVARCVMTPESISLVFSEAAAATFGMSRVDARFAVSPERLSEIAQHLQVIFTSGRPTERPELDFSALEA
jgi:hypothetical protein